MHKTAHDRHQEQPAPLRVEEHDHKLVHLNRYLRSVRNVTRNGVRMVDSNMHNMIGSCDSEKIKVQLDDLLHAFTYVDYGSKGEFERLMKSSREKTDEGIVLNDEDMLMIMTRPIGLSAMLFYTAINGSIGESEAGAMLHGHRTRFQAKEHAKTIASELLKAAYYLGFITIPDAKGRYVPTGKCEFFVSHWYSAGSHFPLWLYDKLQMDGGKARY